MIQMVDSEDAVLARIEGHGAPVLQEIAVEEFHIARLALVDARQPTWPGLPEAVGDHPLAQCLSKELVASQFGQSLTSQGGPNQAEGLLLECIIG